MKKFIYYLIIISLVFHFSRCDEEEGPGLSKEEIAEGLKEALESAGAVFELSNGHLLAAHFGDPAADAKSLDTGVALFDAGPRAQISVSGDDAADLLHNMCTNEIRKLAANRHQYLVSPWSH